MIPRHVKYLAEIWERSLATGDPMPIANSFRSEERVCRNAFVKDNLMQVDIDDLGLGSAHTRTKEKKIFWK